MAATTQKYFKGVPLGGRGGAAKRMERLNKKLAVANTSRSAVEVVAHV